jgi:cellulose biosynthesis protein BcsQ
MDEIREILEDLLPGKVLKAVVRHDNSLAELDGYGINRLTRERSRGAADYSSLVDEILELTT